MSHSWSLYSFDDQGFLKSDVDFLVVVVFGLPTMTTINPIILNLMFIMALGYKCRSDIIDITMFSRMNWLSLRNNWSKFKTSQEKNTGLYGEIHKYIYHFNKVKPIDVNMYNNLMLKYTF